MMVKRGEIYWVEFDPVKGSEQGGLRPALIVQQDIGNQYSPTTVIVAITRTLPPRPYPFVVIVEPEESGLPARKCHQLFPNRNRSERRTWLTTAPMARRARSASHWAVGRPEDGRGRSGA